jgi:hypothetical protein
MAENINIVYLDIETAPQLGYSWGVWETNIIEVYRDWYMLSFAVKINDGPTKAYALPDYKGYKKDKTNDYLLIKDLWNILDGADVVVAHNADAFDVKKSNARFLVHKLPPPSPFKTVDTLKLARTKFRFDSNKLDDLCRYLDIGRKLPHEGKDTWLGCMSGDPKSWKTMVKYNKHDVDLLYEVYMRLRPWATNHPPIGVLVGRPEACPICGSDKLQARGTSVTRKHKYHRFHCQSCGGWSTGKRIDIK